MDKVQQKIFAYQATFVLLAVLFCTYLRLSLLFVYPLIAVFIFYLCNWKLSRNALWIFALLLICWVFSFRNGLYLKYNLVSFYYYLPFLLLLFANPQPGKEHPNFFKLMMTALTGVVIINDIPGIIQYCIHPNDDSFVGIYGIFTVSQNGLSILNAILFFYYLAKFQSDKKYINLGLLVFFLICCVLGFYGAGQLVLIASIVLSFLKIKGKNLIQLALVSIVTLSVVVILMKLISPNTLDYNINIIRLFLDPSAPGAPRKLTAFQNYFTAYPSHIIDFLFGSGPGTFNSRSAFMVGSPTYFNVDFIKSDVQPFYFKNYAYPLWNYTNTGPYDGFMNQPFSSLLALLGEYGLIITSLILVVIGNRFVYYSRISNDLIRQSGTSVELKMYKFCSIYAALLVIIDNYIEYPEIIALLLIIAKLGRQQLNKIFIFNANKSEI